MSIKKKQTLLCFFAIVTLIGTLILAPARSEENIITVNPSSEPLTREETRAMTEKAAAAFYADPALRDELESEITLKIEIVPAEGLPDDELAVYTLTHGGNSRRFFMETFGEPDENGDFAILFHPALVDVSRPVTVGPEMPSAWCRSTRRRNSWKPPSGRTEIRNWPVSAGSCTARLFHRPGEPDTDRGWRKHKRTGSRKGEENGT